MELQIRKNGFGWRKLRTAEADTREGALAYLKQQMNEWRQNGTDEYKTAEYRIGVAGYNGEFTHED